MKLISAAVVCFGSYGHLEFEYNDQGLALIHGATGSGKSTLQDVAPWLLYGRTAKDGNVDDIRSWHGEGRPTEGTIEVLTATGLISVTRTRGTQSQNDLYWTEADGTPIRGKDITETQQLLNLRLGVDYDTFILGSYYNEFSPTGQFFTAKSDIRRQLLNRLANMELPLTLLERISDDKKANRKALLQISESLNRQQGRLEERRSQAARDKEYAKSWGQKQARKIQDLKFKSRQFEEEMEQNAHRVKQQYEEFEDNRRSSIQNCILAIADYEAMLAAHTAVCDKCSQPNQTHQNLRLNILSTQVELRGLQGQRNPHVSPPQNNPHTSLLEAARLETNPFKHTAFDSTQLENELIELQKQHAQLKDKESQLNQLKDILAKLREELVKNAVSYVESETNRYLEAYFDAEIRVEFFATDADNIEVILRKSGYECSYRQLSKGQRGMLKLAFSVAVMKAASNKAGIDFQTLFFDEALDGLSEDLKVKAFSLFDELSLSHGTVLVIDHSPELKSLFFNSYCVKINSDVSTITKD